MYSEGGISGMGDLDRVGVWVGSWVGSTLVWWSIQVCWVQDLVFGVSISKLTN